MNFYLVILYDLFGWQYLYIFKDILNAIRINEEQIFQRIFK